MPGAGPAQSATVRRLREQLDRLETLEPDAPVRSLRPAGEDQSRFSVRVGRHSFGPVHAHDLDALAIDVGTPLDAPARERLARAMAREAARADALRLLRTRSRSRRDMVNRLGRKGHQRDTAAEAIDRLAAVGLIDDEAFARDRAASIAARGSAGPRAAEHKLRALGVDAALAARAVREAFEGSDLDERAADAARRRARSLGDRLDPETRRRRLYGFLARRGYDHQTCMRAVADALGGRPGDRAGEDD